MATISVSPTDSLVVEAIPNNPTTVKLTVKYTLTPSKIEKLARTVFSESIRLIGNDSAPQVVDVNDIVITTFPVQAFAVSNTTPTVSRTRTRNVLKSAMNEDPAFQGTGAGLTDEVFAQITLAYAANPPVQSALPSPAPTNRVTGSWK